MVHISGDKKIPWKGTDSLYLKKIRVFLNHQGISLGTYLPIR